MIGAISDQIKLIANQISSLIGSNMDINSRKETLKTISSIGDNSTGQLLVLLWNVKLICQLMFVKYIKKVLYK